MSIYGTLVYRRQMRWICCDSRLGVLYIVYVHGISKKRHMTSIKPARRFANITTIIALAAFLFSPPPVHISAYNYQHVAIVLHWCFRYAFKSIDYLPTTLDVWILVWRIYFYCGPLIHSVCRKCDELSIEAIWMIGVTLCVSCITWLHNSLWSNLISCIQTWWIQVPQYKKNSLYYWIECDRAWFNGEIATDQCFARNGTKSFTKMFENVPVELNDELEQSIEFPSSLPRIYRSFLRASLIDNRILSLHRFTYESLWFIWYIGQLVYTSSLSLGCGIWNKFEFPNKNGLFQSHHNATTIFATQKCYTKPHLSIKDYIVLRRDLHSFRPFNGRTTTKSECPNPESNNSIHCANLLNLL